MTPTEIAANTLNSASIILAGRNSVHTWWTGILGCALFCWVFFGAKLYGDAALQVFFIGASVGGWWNWTRRREAPELPIRRTLPSRLAVLGVLSLALTALNAWLLSRFTDAAAPVPDSAVLAFSVLGQFLLMGRRVETWWCWLVVNTISVPLFISRDLHLTAGLYALYWVNAIVSLRLWQRKLAS